MRLENMVFLPPGRKPGAEGPERQHKAEMVWKRLMQRECNDFIKLFEVNQSFHLESNGSRFMCSAYPNHPLVMWCIWSRVSWFHRVLCTSWNVSINGMVDSCNTWIRSVYWSMRMLRKKCALWLSKLLKKKNNYRDHGVLWGSSAVRMWLSPPSSDGLENVVNDLHRANVFDIRNQTCDFMIIALHAHDIVETCNSSHLLCRDKAALEEKCLCVLVYQWHNVKTM